MVKLIVLTKLVKVSLNILITFALLFAQFAYAEKTQVRLGIQLSPLAGAQYYQLKSLLSSIKVGDELRLERDANNKHDKYAIKVFWQEQLLGHVPRSENQHLALAIDEGHQLFAKVTNIKDALNPWQRLEINVWIRF